MNLLYSYSSPDVIHPFFTHNGTSPLKKNSWLDYIKFHELNRRLAPLQFIYRDALLNPVLNTDQKALLESMNLSLSFTQDNRPFFKSQDNEEFIEVLRDLGFFNIYSTNSGAYGVQLSQVVMFLEFGIQWVRNGFTMPGHLYNIHHLSQDVCDNRVGNLDVLPVDIHSFVTSLQCGKGNIPTNLYSKDYLRSVMSVAPLTTKSGKVVKKDAWVGRLSQVIRSTLVASTAFCIERMNVLRQNVEVDMSEDLVVAFGALVQLGTSNGLVTKVADFLKGKAIPTLASIQSSVKGWYKDFKAFLGASNVVPLFNSQAQCA